MRVMDHLKVAAGLSLASALATIGLLTWGRSQGSDWAWPPDDAYIHMAVARNVAEHGTWGINPGEFASASSSPAWTLLLAASFATFGATVWMPLVFNLAFATAAVLCAHAWVRGRASGSWTAAAVLAALIAAPLPVLAGLGMEHVLHALGASVLAWLLVREVEGTSKGSERGGTLALAVVLPLVRYETVFEIVAGMALLMMAGRKGRALAVGAASSLGVGAFGAWSVSHGAVPIPNSLLMKSALAGGLLHNIRNNLSEGAATWALVGLVGVLSVLHRERNLSLFGRLFVITGVGHLLFASVGWFYRYEAYLLWSGTLVAVALLSQVARGRGPLLAAAAIPCVLIGLRTADAVRYFPGRCVYILDVKVALARALDEVAPDATVALHDIGALAWYSHAHVVDIAGLGTDEVARLSFTRRFTGPTIAEIVARRGAVVAVATRSWMEADRPPGWVVAGELGWGLDAERRIEPVVFYALQPGADRIAVSWLRAAVAGMRGRGFDTADGQGNGTR